YAHRPEDRGGGEDVLPRSDRPLLRDEHEVAGRELTGGREGAADHVHEGDQAHERESGQHHDVDPVEDLLAGGAAAQPRLTNVWLRGWALVRRRGRARAGGGGGGHRRLPSVRCRSTNRAAAAKNRKATR